MLFENVFQSAPLRRPTRHSCDLMLFENVFQFTKKGENKYPVVI